MAARYYDPRFGRFTSCDPEQTTMSPYSYCLNNPVSLVDPTGHRSGCAGGGYSLNYPRKDYNFLMWAKNHPMPQEKNSMGNSNFWGHATYGREEFRDASGKPPFAYSEAEAEYLFIEQLKAIVEWMRAEIPEFNYWEYQLENKYSGGWFYSVGQQLFDYAIDYELIPGMGKLGSGVYESKELGWDAEIQVCKEWFAPGDLEGVMANVASGILHEVGELTARHFFGLERYKGGQLVAEAWEDEYRQRDFFAHGNVGRKNMDYWWSRYGSHVWSLGRIAYEYKTNPWTDTEWEYYNRRNKFKP